MKSIIAMSALMMLLTGHAALLKIWKEHAKIITAEGAGLSGLVWLSPGFRKLSSEHFVSCYNKASRRAIFLDYDGTLVPQSSINKAPSAEVVSILNTLCNDPKNNVFIVSGRGRDSLDEWFSACEKLNLVYRAYWYSCRTLLFCQVCQ